MDGSHSETHVLVPPVDVGGDVVRHEPFQRWEVSTLRVGGDDEEVKVFFGDHDQILYHGHRDCTVTR